MKYDALQQAAHYTRARRRKKTWYKVVTCLAAVVVFFTAYALMLPAITEENEIYCAMEEHIHDESCYVLTNICVSHKHTPECMRLDRQLTCDLEEEPAHQHAETCYDESLVLICGLAECEMHTHDESCMLTSSELVCDLAEDEAHSHQESCYVQTQILNCGIEQTAGHQHEDACYQAQQAIVCGMQESQGHCHDNACYDAEFVQTCPFDAEHEHTDICFQQQLVCEIEAHAHSLACYSNPDADLETAEIWERDLPMSLSGIPSEDLVAVAKTQLGYRESERNYIVREDGTKMGYTRYGEWYGDAYREWNTMYVSFCLSYANVTNIPIDADCRSWVEALQMKNLFKPAADYSPQTGDLVFFDIDADAVADRVGIVEKVKKGITVIEGDCGDEVGRARYELLDARIMGYVVLPQGKKAASLLSLEGTYTQVNSARNLRNALNSGTSHIRLTANISTSDTLTLPSNCNIVLDLNGYTLTHTGSNAYLTINSGTFTLWDNTANTENLSEASGNNYGRLASMNGKTLTYYVTETRVTDPAIGTTSETLRQHTVTATGAIKAGSQPIFYLNGGSVNIESGMIYGGTKRAIFMNNGTVNLNGGYLCGFVKSFNTNTNNWSANPYDEFGGAVYIASGTFNCNGGVIAGNSAASGGAICVNGGTLNITGGIISGNCAASVRESYDTTSEYNGGGAVYAHNSASVNMSGGYMTNNSVTSDESYWDGGGGIFLDDDASFTLTGGYLTGNVAHGGGAVRTGWYSKSLFTMSGGFLTANVARKAEGGALFLGMEDGGADASGGAIITGGYVTNNRIIATEHWGGGGLFCSDGASLYVCGMLVTENTAAGFGGGLAGCSTGHIFIYSNDGCAIYNNEDCVEGEPHFSGDASDKPYDRQICDEIFQSYDHADYFCALESAISGDMLGGYPANWTGSADGIPVSSHEHDALTANVVMGLTAHPTQEAILAAEAKATLFVTGNHSDTHGGGILCNGVLKIGGPQDLEVPVRLLPNIAKLFVDGNGNKISMEGFEFTAVITDELGNTISTATCQNDGSFLFDNEIVLNEEGTYTFYLKELNDGKYDNIQYDTSFYRITVTVVKGEPIAIDLESTKAYYYTTQVTMERRGTDGTWEHICTIDGSYCGSVILPLFGDAYAFTNILSDTTSIKVVKKWNSNYSEASVDVLLCANGTQIDRQTLSDSNNWSYTWDDLPMVDASGNAYHYTALEVAVGDYAVEYITTSGGSETQTYWIPATELVEGESYIITNAEGNRALYATDASIDAAYTTSDKATVSTQKGALTIDGKTYTSWLVGDMNSRMVYTAVVPSDLSKKNYNHGLTLKNNGTSSSSWFLVQDAGGNYLKGTNNVTYCSIMLIQNGILKGHDGFEWTPNNLRTVVYSNNKFTTSTGTSNAAKIYRKVVSMSVSNIQTITIVNTRAEEALYEVNLTKVSAADQRPLVGAEFELLNAQGEVLFFTGGKGIYTLSDSLQSGATSTLVTATGGKLLLQVLPAGTYTLRETKPPPDHMPIEDYTFTLGGENGVPTLYLVIQDEMRDFTLPDTGGVGNQWYTLGGLLCVSASILLLYKRMKRRKEDFAPS